MNTATPAFDGKQFAKSLPLLPGVYQMLDAQNQVIYVGKARSLKKRVASYFSGKAQDNKTMALVSSICNMRFDITRSDGEALLLENQLIKKHKPRYNILLKDGKSYPYIYCSSGDDVFPRFEFRRGAKKGKGQYFGPFPSAYSVRTTLNHLQKIFKVRQCNNANFSNRSRPCLQHQINRCTAPCVDLVSTDDYAKQVEHTQLFLQGHSQQVIEQLIETMDQHAQQQAFEKAAQVRDQIKALRLIQSQQFVEADLPQNIDVFAVGVKAGIAIVTVGTVRNGQVLGNRDYFPKMPKDTETSELLTAFISQYYFDKPIAESLITSIVPAEKNALTKALSEIAGRKIHLTSQPKLARKKLLEQTQVNMLNALESRVQKYATWQSKWQLWADEVGLTALPNRVECFDISHNFGDQTRASCVVFDSKGANKDAYRQYIIEGITGGDDYAAMRQVIDKRLDSIKKHDLDLPDVFLIDGGKGQVNEVKKILQQRDVEKIQLIGVVKDDHRTAGEERLYVEATRHMLKPERHSLLSLMVQYIRDEAHRFAIKNHRQALKKAKKTSFLEAIPGIGVQKRNALLKHFGGFQGLKKASLEDIQKVPGISEKLATLVYQNILKSRS
ncbi:excinuclease ABC subunit UvrC [Marinicella sp. W31]|uniref:excinuclease ABC subunit UvrC n=1 Tax=Marinicella sp. W31 TaxID=3023713 RepID=UPI003757DF31